MGFIFFFQKSPKETQRRSLRLVVGRSPSRRQERMLNGEQNLASESDTVRLGELRTVGTVFAPRVRSFGRSVVRSVCVGRCVKGVWPCLSVQNFQEVRRRRRSCARAEWFLCACWAVLFLYSLRCFCRLLPQKNPDQSPLWCSTLFP